MGSSSNNSLALELEASLDDIDWVSKDDSDHAPESAKEQFCGQFLAWGPYVFCSLLRI
jgi:hypothetical protein